MLFLLFAACISVVSRAVNVSYTADESTIFPNPERGFITMLTGHLTQSKPYAVKGKESYLDAHASNDKGTLILVHYYLDNFKSTATLPNAVLNGFDEDMAVLRNKGMKAIIRFSYVVMMRMRQHTTLRSLSCSISPSINRTGRQTQMLFSVSRQVS